MKHMLPAPWTQEDEAIAFRHGRGYLATTLRASSLLADIQDAELLYAWRRFRILTRQPMAMPNIWWLRDDGEPRWQPIGGQL